MIGRVQIYIYLQQMEFISAFAKNIMGMFTFPSCRQYHGDLVESGMYKGKDPSFIQAKGLCTSPVLPKELSSDRNKSNGKIENVEKRKSQWKESFYLLAGTP